MPFSIAFLYIYSLCSAVFCAGVDKRILVWDIGKAHKLCELKGHTDTVYQLMFSRDGTILASGIIYWGILWL